jgi:hypothetical protein
MEEAGLGGSRYALPSWVPDWTSKGPPNDPSLIYFVDEIPVSRDNENHKVVRSQAVKPGIDNTLDVSCSGLVLSQRFWSPTPTSFDDDRAFENTLLAAKRLITSVMPLDTEKDTVWGMVYKLITSGRQEGSLCTNRSTSRVQSAQAFANMIHGLEDGRLDSIPAGLRK